MKAVQVITRMSVDWAVRSFGNDHVRDNVVRGERALEELAELCQCLWMSEERAMAVVSMVYSKPIGNTFQEAGGTALTILVLFDTLGIDLESAALAELRRILALPPDYFKRRNDAKVALLNAKSERK
jgi:hypothetical protein